MLSPLSVGGSSSDDRKLLKIFHRLSPQDKESLQAYSEFLLARAATVSKEEPLVEPEIIPRPDEESVISAIKRLTQSYPMVDKSTMLNETSALMTQHVMQGREASSIIDELESLFTDGYQRYLADTQTNLSE